MSRRSKTRIASLRAALNLDHNMVGDSKAMRDVYRRIAPRGADRFDGAHHRRERHRQGAGRARDPPQQPARGAAVRRHQLRGDHRDAARERALRSRARRVHRRGRAEEGQARDRRRRHGVPGRDRRALARRCRPSCCACCRSASSSASAAPSRSSVDVRLVAATNRDLESGHRGRRLPPRSVLPPERRLAHDAGAARAARRHPAARGLVRPPSRRQGQATGRRFLAGGAGLPAARTTGPATFASWKTRSSTRSCSAPIRSFLPDDLPDAVLEAGASAADGAAGSARFHDAIKQAKRDLIIAGRRRGGGQLQRGRAASRAAPELSASADQEPSDEGGAQERREGLTLKTERSEQRRRTTATSRWHRRRKVIRPRRRRPSSGCLSRGNPATSPARVRAASGPQGES